MTGEMVFIMRRDVMYDEFGEMPWYLGAYGATSTPFKYHLWERQLEAVLYVGSGTSVGRSLEDSKDSGHQSTGLSPPYVGV